MDIKETLKSLNLDRKEAAALLSVCPRTLGRWVEKPEEITGPAKQALIAWRKLNERCIPWRNDGTEYELAVCAPTQFDGALLKREPATPWCVCIHKKIATLGPLSVTFERGEDKSFRMGIYRRTDRKPDIRRDMALLEDAYVCIYLALRGKQS